MTFRPTVHVGEAHENHQDRRTSARISGDDSYCVLTVHSIPWWRNLPGTDACLLATTSVKGGCHG